MTKKMVRTMMTKRVTRKMSRIASQECFVDFSIGYIYNIGYLILVR